MARIVIDNGTVPIHTCSHPSIRPSIHQSIKAHTHKHVIYIHNGEWRRNAPGQKSKSKCLLPTTYYLLVTPTPSSCHHRQRCHAYQTSSFNPVVSNSRLLAFEAFEFLNLGAKVNSFFFLILAPNLSFFEIR